jgi:hypothetical protein
VLLAVNPIRASRKGGLTRSWAERRWTAQPSDGGGTRAQAEEHEGWTCEWQAAGWEKVSAYHAFYGIDHSEV